MRAPTEAECKALQPLLEKLEEKRAGLRQADLELGLAVQALRRACKVPSDAVIDECSFEWVRMEQTPQGLKRVPVKTDK